MDKIFLDKILYTVGNNDVGLQFLQMCLLLINKYNNRFLLFQFKFSLEEYYLLGYNTLRKHC
jgi:hypothetical protein